MGVCCASNNTTTEGYHNKESFVPHKVHSTETFDSPSVKQLVARKNEDVYSMSNDYVIPEELLIEYEKTRTMVS